MLPTQRYLFQFVSWVNYGQFVCCASFPFDFEGGKWVIVLVPGHCLKLLIIALLSFIFTVTQSTVRNYRP